MVNFGPNDQDPRDGKRGGEKADPRESGGELSARDAGDRNPGGEQEGDDRHEGRRHSEPLGEPVESRENGAQQHGRRGQAESPVQTNHFEPPRQKEGHE
jgi:hypothetical protein